MDTQRKYPVIEIFTSMQGEGFNTGREMIFLRFGGCNLACPWCDTPYNDYEMVDAESIIKRVKGFGINSLLLTGGEPLVIDGLKWLVEQFKSMGYWVGVETNGVSVVEDGIVNLFDYITVSPKSCYAELYHNGPAIKEADEVRIIAEDNVLEFCHFIRSRIRAKHYFLSPCERDGEMNIEQTIRLLGWLNQSSEDAKWLLSLQTHKLCGIN